jgi:hypothetical protein
MLKKARAVDAAFADLRQRVPSRFVAFDLPHAVDGMSMRTPTS